MDIILSVMTVMVAASCMVALFISSARDRKRAKAAARKRRQ